MQPSADHNFRLLGSEYQLDQLQPWKEQHDVVEGLNDHDVHSSISQPESASSKSASGASYNDSSKSQATKRLNSEVMFAGPPPPIHNAALREPLWTMSVKGGDDAEDDGASDEIRLSADRMWPQSVVSGTTSRSPCAFRQALGPSSWQGLRKRNETLQRELQALLDLQAVALASGTRRNDSADRTSDADSSAPTETFYSTATSRSQMRHSLNEATRSTSSGDVIPVRQPSLRHPGGLRSARNRLRGAMLSLADLAFEEQDYIASALQERRIALGKLANITRKRARLVSELEGFELDEEEPLRKELAALTTRYNAVDVEISNLEERLSNLRSQRRRLRNKINNTRSSREAGLSGFRGALKEVDFELGSLLRDPPFEPLDVSSVKGIVSFSPDGATYHGRDFCGLVPERRTSAMAESWWQAEVEILAARESELAVEQDALEEGAALWEHVMSLVTAFESDLRDWVRPTSKNTGASSPRVRSDSPTKSLLSGKHMEGMLSVMSELQSSVQQAEQRGWNLLICAIGAELEAFTQAHDILKGLGPSADSAESAVELDLDIGPTKGIDDGKVVAVAQASAANGQVIADCALNSSTECHMLSVKEGIA